MLRRRLGRRLMRCGFSASAMARSATRRRVANRRNTIAIAAAVGIMAHFGGQVGNLLHVNCNSEGGCAASCNDDREKEIKIEGCRNRQHHELLADDCSRECGGERGVSSGGPERERAERQQ